MASGCKIRKEPQAPIPTAPIPVVLTQSVSIPHTTPIAVAPIPNGVPIICPAPVPISTGSLQPKPRKSRTRKTYIERQMEKQRAKRKDIETSSHLVISNLAVEGYLRNIQSLHSQSDCALFRMDIPLGIIHLCYRYCREFKDFLILLTSEEAVDRYRAERLTEFKLLSIKHFTNQYGIRQSNVRKYLIPFNRDGRLSQNIKPERVQGTGLCFIPHLKVSQKVKESMYQQLAAIKPRCNERSGIIRMTRNRLDVLHFESPYFTEYETVSELNKMPSAHSGHVFGRFGIPYINSPNFESFNACCYIPGNNTLLALRDKYINVLDIYNMKWLNARREYGTIMMQRQRKGQSVCLFQNKLFIIGGFLSETHAHMHTYNRRLFNTVEVLDVTKIDEIDWDKRVSDEQFALRTSLMTSKLMKTRNEHGCDVMSAKGGMIVVGGGYRNCRDIEMYDHQKDKWILHSAQTQQTYPTAKLWCSGNLVFIARNENKFGSLVGHLERIEYLDVRDNAPKWQFLDDKQVEKLFDLYSTKHKFAYRNNGLLI